MFIFILSNETFHENSQNVCASAQSKTWGPHYRVISSFNMAPFTAYSGKYMLNTFLFDTDAFNGIHSIYMKKKSTYYMYILQVCLTLGNGQIF